MIGQSVGAYTNATHGMTLAAVSLAYYRHILEAGLHKFVRFATNVWQVNPDGKTDKEVADEGLEEFKKWMQQIGVVMNLTDLGVKPEMWEGIAKGSFILEGGYKVLTHEEIIEILKESM